MSFLELRHVSKIYGEGPTQVQALRDVSLSVEPGELVAVMGPSGSGKSTLLTIAGSLEEPTSGDVLVGGRSAVEAVAQRAARLRRRSIGYVFQDFNLLAGLTAVENVSLPLELDGVAARTARAAGMAALDELGLGDRAARFPDELSGGERQRVAIARAVVGDRQAAARRRAVRRARLGQRRGGDAAASVAACQRGVAGVVVTHDAQLASWADRVVFLRDGRIVDQTMPPPGPESLLQPDQASERGRPGPADANTGRRRCGSAAARCCRWALAPVPARMAPADAGAGADHGRGRRDDLRCRAAARTSRLPQRRVRIRQRRWSTCRATTRIWPAEIAALRARFGRVDVIENQVFATGLVTGASCGRRTRTEPTAGPCWPWCEATTRRPGRSR